MMKANQTAQTARISASSLVLFVVFSLLASAALALFIANTASAEQRGGLWNTIRVNEVISDGKDGRVWRQWKKNIKERPVKTVEITLRRQSGNNDTYVNLRYGSSGSTFENGKRVPLGDNNTHTVSWNVNGEAPNGQQLVLNAYKGAVFVETVRVIYDVPVRPPVIPRPPVTIQPHASSHSTTTTIVSAQGSTAYDPEMLRRCEERYNVRTPSIRITNSRPTGNVFSGKYRVEGVIQGACIQEAGYYERGRLKDKLDIPLDTRFQRHEFNFKVRSGHDGEIRVLTINGDDDDVQVDQIITQGQNSGSLW